jgi:hypothetical protein
MQHRSNRRQQLRAGRKRRILWVMPGGDLQVWLTVVALTADSVAVDVVIEAEAGAGPEVEGRMRRRNGSHAQSWGASYNRSVIHKTTPESRGGSC